jgi:hypothetical protein
VGLLNLERDSLVLISEDPSVQKRYLQACEFLLFQAVTFNTLDSFFKDEKVKPHTVFLDIDLSRPDSVASIQKLNQHFQDEVEIILIDETTSEKSRVAQKLFVSHLVDRKIFLNTFMTEFLIFQKGLCGFYEINVQDLFPDTLILFNAYHFMPLNQKYVTVINGNLNLTEAKYKKFESSQNLFIHHQSAASYNQYIESYFDRFNVGIRKRIRSKFYQILSQWRESLLIGLTTHPRPTTFPGSVDDLSDHLGVLNEYLRESPDPWSLLFELSNASILQFERSAIELIISAFVADHFSQSEMDRLIELKWALTCCQNLTPSLLYRKVLFSPFNLTDEEKAERKLFLNQLDYQLEEVLQKDFTTYAEGFIVKNSAAQLDPFYIHFHIGEKITQGFYQSRKNQYSKSDLFQGVMSELKKENLLNEAWIEEYRQFFNKQSYAIKKAGS